MDSEYYREMEHLGADLTPIPDPDPVDTTDHSEPDVPDLHPDQCAKSGHTPARIARTMIDRGGNEHSRLYECPCGEFEQVVLATGQSYGKYRTPTMEDI